jgi:hypothetical protein
VAAVLVSPALRGQRGIGFVQGDAGQQAAQQMPQLNFTTEHINAVVVSAVDGKPVARVLVTTPDRRMALMTDFEGRFSFDFRRIVPGSGGTSTAMSNLGQLGYLAGLGGASGADRLPVQFQVRKPGYISNTVFLELPMVQPDTTEPTLQLKIVPAGLILGHIDPDNGQAPPQGLSVQLLRRYVQNGAARWNSVAYSQVNSDGDFRFPDLQPDDYKISTNAWTAPGTNRQPRPDSVAGLAPIYYPDAATLDAAGILHLDAGQTATVRLSPRAATFYRVTVPLGGGASIQGAGVTLTPGALGLSLGYSAGTHELQGYLPSGSYDARINAFAPPTGGDQPNPGAASGPRMIGFAGQPRTSTAVVHIEVGSSPVRTAPVTPVPGFDIPVSVRRDFNNPNQNANQQRQANIAPVFINLQSTSGNGFGASMAPMQPGAGDGDLKLQNVSEGVYHVMIQSTQGGYVAAASCGATDLLREPLTITGPGSASPIEVTLRDDFATITGTVQVPSTAAPADTFAGPIYVVGVPLDRPEATPQFGIAMQQNKFQLGEVPPGHYLLLASHQQLFQGLEYTNPDVLRTLMTEGVALTVGASEKTDIQLPLMPEGTN